MTTKKVTSKKTPMKRSVLTQPQHLAAARLGCELEDLQAWKISGDEIIVIGPDYMKYRFVVADLWEVVDAESLEDDDSGIEKNVEV